MIEFISSIINFEIVRTIFLWIWAIGFISGIFIALSETSIAMTENILGFALLWYITWKSTSFLNLSIYLFITVCILSTFAYTIYFIGELKYKNKNKVMKGEIILNEKDR